MARSNKSTNDGLTTASAEEEAGYDGLRKTKKGKKEAVEKKGGGTLLWILLGGGVVLCFLFVLCAGVGGVGAYFYFYAGKGVTLANYNKLRAGMTEKEVTDILGSPTRTERAGGLGKTLVWESGKDSISVGFMNDKVVMMGGVIDKQIYLGNNNAETNKATDGGKPPDLGGGPKPPEGDKPGVISKATANKLEDALIKHTISTEAEVIAMAGVQPKRLGPQQIPMANIQSNDTLQWSGSGSGTFTVWIVNGKSSGFERKNIR